MGMSVSGWILILAIAALAIRVAWILFARTIPISDFAEYDARGWGIAEGRGFVDANGSPSSFQGLGYPAFLAGVYLVWGHSILAAQIANALLGIATVLLTFLVARRLTIDGRALLAAALVAFMPSHILYSSVLATENLFTVLFLAFIWLMWPSPALRRYVVVVLIAGAILGLSWLVRPTLLLFPIALALMLAATRVSWKRAVATTAGVGMIALLVVTPWAARNVAKMDALTLDTAGGINFWIGNGPHSTGTYVVLPPDNPIDGYHNEADRNQAGFRLGLEYIVDQPIDWVAGFPKKFWHLWVSDRSAVNWSTQQTERSVPSVVPRTLEFLAQGYWMALALLMVAAILPTVTHPRAVTRMNVLIIGVFVYWSLFHFMGFGSGRFHLPVIPLMAIVAADIVCDMAGRLRDRVGWIPFGTSISTGFPRALQTRER